MNHHRSIASHIAPLVLLFALPWWGACGGETVQQTDRFWLRAPGAALLKLTPPLPLTAPGTVRRHVVTGTVTTHTRSRRVGVDYRLTVVSAQGETSELSYRIGRGRRMPLQVDDRVHLQFYTHAHAADEGVDRGLLVYGFAKPSEEADNSAPALKSAGAGAGATARTTPLATTPVPTAPTARAALAQTPALGAPGAAPNQSSRPSNSTADPPTLLVAIDQGGILDSTRLPEALRGLRVTDLAAYQESGRFRGDCQDIREHRFVRLIRPDLLTGSDAKVRKGRFFAPGSRLRMRDPTGTSFDIVVLTNMTVTRSTCRDKPEPTWSWAAIREVDTGAQAPAPPTKLAPSS